MGAAGFDEPPGKFPHRRDAERSQRVSFNGAAASMSRGRSSPAAFLPDLRRVGFNGAAASMRAAGRGGCAAPRTWPWAGFNGAAASM